MCRLLAYVGSPVLVADIVLWPARSIIKQSYDAKERKEDGSMHGHLSLGSLNGDGFGIGWYSDSIVAKATDPTPCVFTSVTPAWNNENLGRLSCKIVSPLVFAHVRAAMPGMPVSEQNCHPFQWGRYLFMHNGMVGGFMRIRRALLATLSDAAYDTVQSFHSDSAICFSIFLHHLPSLSVVQTPQALLQAMEATINTVLASQRAAGVTEVSLLNFVVSDGSTMLATRFIAGSEDEAPASLYYAEGSAFQRSPHAAASDGTAAGASDAYDGRGFDARQEPCSPTVNAATARHTSITGEGEYTLMYGAVGTRVVLVASEPITSSAAGDWVAVPRNTVLIVSHNKGGCLNLLSSPLGACCAKARREEVARCLEAATGAAEVASRSWSLQRPPRGEADSTPGSLWLDGKAKVVAGEEQRLSGHSGPVLCLALCGERLFSSSTDLTIKVWDMAGGQCLATLTGHNKPVQSLWVAREHLYSTAGRYLRVWNIAEPSFPCVRVLQLPRNGGALGALAVDANNHIYVAGQDSVVRGFRPESCAADTGGVNGCLKVATGFECWRLGSLEFVRVLRGHRGSILTLFAFNEARLLLSGGRDNLIRCWDMETLVCRRTLSGHKNDIMSIAGLAPAAGPTASVAAAGGDGSPLGRSSSMERSAALFFVSASMDGTVRLWTGQSWACLQIFTAAAVHAPMPFLSAAVSARYLAAGSPDGQVRIWGTAEELLAAPAGLLPCATGHGAHSAAADQPVSSDASLRDDCWRGAKFLASLLESLGAEIKLSRPIEDKHPIVLGRLGRNPDRPTICFYGHYDVQPAMEREWLTHPWEVAAVNGYLYGRGTSDNKGPILGFVYAVKEMQEAVGGELAFNVAFVFEGEEENGSKGFKEAVQTNLHWFEGTQLIVISNTLWVGEQVPCLTYGMRGMISASIEVKGPQRDLHSGNEGGVFNEPLNDLTKVLASLVDGSNRICIPGFLDRVRPNTLAPALARLDNSAEFSLSGYRDALGVPQLVRAASTSELLRARWCEPALSVVDVRLGSDDDNGGEIDPFYRFGPTRFSVIPHAVVGNVSVRFVPDQDAEELITALRQHVDTVFAGLGSSNTVTVRVKSVGDWWEADPESRLFKMAERAVAREWGRAPLFVREGGTMPVASALEKMLGAPALLVPLGQASDACHLANERISRTNLVRGKNVIRNLLEEIAAV
ncbi:hypothetical protein WJX81_003920 [Elliptochloris bilobata]|uniref:Glutamine amidotransferase type-2 domain-containing protein n=1 Tax=Elliptochloris bilobata TaxID=381761 RepID=A0AAW1S033_9CHLO